jgi:tetratricopeptide (TPR) repeat protein
MSRGTESHPQPGRPRTVTDPGRTQDYERAVSAALEALERNDVASARQSLDAAERLRPGASELRDLHQRLQQASQLQRLQRTRRSAAQHEESERWEAALEEYEQALRIDKQATFALHGKARVERVLAIKRQLEFYIANPDRLQSPGPLAHAREVLGAAAATPNGGTHLAASREQLRALIERGNSARSVVLRSDGATEVTVYQVGRLGQFKERNLTLAPGEYTAVGSRPGYRDARIRFRVSPDDPQTLVDIRCGERI